MINSNIDKRIKRLRSMMRKRKLDAILVAKKENYVYLSGFTGSAAWLVVTESNAVLVTDFRYTEQASSQARGYDITQYKGSITAALNEVIERYGIEKLGFEDNDTVFSKYDEYSRKLNIKELVPIGGMIEELRQVKDQTELGNIRKAVAIADDTFAHILNFIKPGISELEIAAEMEYYMRKQGASGASFETIVASGVRSSLPHGIASEKKLAEGEAITMDFGAIYNGYCSDMTRTVFLGKPSDELRKIYGIVLDAQLKSAEKVKINKTGREIDLIARELIMKAGYGDYFGHGLGHGVGLEIHEEPRLSMTGDNKMKKGMVVTVEPGIYINGLGGVRIEDMAVVGDDSPEILTASTKDMIIL